MTAKFPSGDAVLLSLHDARGWAWAIGKDVADEDAARELAAALVPEGTDPTWALGAQGFLVGVSVWLQRTKGEIWGWGDLTRALQVDIVTLRDRLQEAYPSAVHFLGIDENEELTRTAASFVSTLMAAVTRLLRPLAEAWDAVPPERRISLVRWLLEGSPRHPAIILQRAAHLPKLSEVWISAAIRILGQAAASPRLTESRTRRIWMVLDEFPQLGRLDGAITMLETCRSKGICTVLAAQSLEQLDVRYGAEQRKAMEAMFRTKIILRVSMGATAIYISQNLIGFREVNAPPRPIPGPAPGTEGEKASDKVETQQLFLPSQLSNLRCTSYGPEGLLIGHGPDIYKLAWPFDNWPDQRPAHVPRQKPNIPGQEPQT